MNIKHLALPAVILVLAGCGPQGVSTSPAATRGWVSVPALPLIQDAVRDLSPTFNGKRIPVLISQLCALGAGQVSQQQADAKLTQLGIDAKALSRDGKDAIALLVNGDRAGQLTACAAAQATAGLTPLNPGDVMRSQPASADKNAKAEQVVDQAVLGRLLSQKVGQARANADIFAIIAARLSATPGLTEEQYRSQAQGMFRELAPDYLRRMNQLLPPEDTRYTLLKLDYSQLAFTTDTGLRYELSTSDGLMLMNNGQLWYGKGQLLGADYGLHMVDLAKISKSPLAVKKY
ncbi:hypothetical protein HNP46_002943 [Pseudomonas nitritireducens]|uniref:Uncharacterized protein n=1 Tax=Pseudomonas nitroreducens TaxID=46680 RepID=A0A7W7P1T8_PSENT|nr:hypothetical protein [Pseudomonas nitritireducens]MBB4864079.1 hypothetical protein [Pseudomonas nitritireducens]